MSRGGTWPSQSPDLNRVGLHEETQLWLVEPMLCFRHKVDKRTANTDQIYILQTYVYMIINNEHLHFWKHPEQ